MPDVDQTKGIGLERSNDGTKVPLDLTSLDITATVDLLRQQLSALDLDTKGNKATLKSRLSTVKRHGLPKPTEAERRKAYEQRRKEVPIRYLFVIDFEATCEAPTAPGERVSRKSFEIIEFPIVLVDLEAGEVIDHFHSFVRPSSANEVLSDFCKDLTGITQEQVSGAPSFLEMVGSVTTWLQNLSVDLQPPPVGPGDLKEAESPKRGAIRNWSIVTDGPTDLESFWSDAVEAAGIDYPAFSLGPYIDSRAAFCSATGAGSVPLVQQLRQFGLVFHGRQHSGLDDARNIARVCLRLAAKHGPLEPNRFLEPVERGRLDGHNIRRRRRRRRQRIEAEAE